MKRIDMMILLDLIGAPSPTFLTYIDPATGVCDDYGQELSRIEDRLLEEINLAPEEKYFTEDCLYEDDIVDDHTPFLEHGLRRVLHVISDPFPVTWHTLEDDWDHLDTEAIVRVNRIVRLFVAEYLNL